MPIGASQLAAIRISKYPGSTITTGVASASASTPTDAAGTQPKYVLVTATAAAWVRHGKGAQTAVAGDLLVQPAECHILQIGQDDTFAALQVAAAGTVTILPIENG